MKTADSKEGYGVVSVINHWVVGLLVIALIIFGLTSERMDNVPERFEIIRLHKATGITVLVLALWRLYWRVKQGFPTPVPGHPSWQITAAKFMHWFLIVAIIAMPVSGLLWSLTGGRDVSYFGLFTIPAFADSEGVSDAFETFHRLFSKVLIAGIVIHTLAGVYNAVSDFKTSGRRMIVPE